MDTNYVDGVGPVVLAAWLNDINGGFYKANSLVPGAVPRTALEKFAEAVNIRDFGAHSVDESGFGTFDSKAAIQAAINTGKPVIVPPGVFEIGGTLNLPRNTVILGSPQFSYENYNDDWQIRIPGYAKVASIIQLRSGVHTNFFSPITSTTKRV